jgi:hypothetical protein
MAGSQERRRDHKRSRPGGEHPLASPRTTEAPERSDQQPVPALEDDRRKRNGNHRPTRCRAVPTSSGVHLSYTRACEHQMAANSAGGCPTHGRDRTTA